MMLPNPTCSPGRLSARPTIEVDPLPPADQTAGIDRDSPPRKHFDFTRIHAGSDRSPGTAGGSSRDLAGEHATLQRSSRNGRRRSDASSTPTSSGYAFSILTVRSSRPTTRFSAWWDTSRDDLVSGRLRWTDLTPPEWREPTSGPWRSWARRGPADHSRRSFSGKMAAACRCWWRGANFERTSAPGLSPDRARRFDASESDAEAELAHANRVATMGELTASIAHEVNQPLAALLTNAETAVRWLARQPPNLEKAKPLIDRIISDGKRAADIVSRIRDFSKKAPRAGRSTWRSTKPFWRVIGLTRAAMSEHGVLVNDAIVRGAAAHFGGQGPIAAGDPELDHERH